MKTAWTTSFLSLLLFCLPAVSGSGVLRVDPATVDLGRIERGRTDVPFSFRIENTGGASVRIRGVRAPCGCVRVEAKAQTLEPAKSMMVAGSLDPGSLAGRVDKSVIVETDIAGEEQVWIRLTAFVPFGFSGLRLAPASGKLSAVRMPTGLVASCQLQNGGPGDVIVRSITLPEGWRCEATFPLTVAADTTREVRFVSPAPKSSGEMGELRYVVHTESPTAAKLEGSIRYREATIRVPPVSDPKTGPKPAVGI